MIIQKKGKFKNLANLALSKFGNFRKKISLKIWQLWPFSQKNPGVECQLPFFLFLFLFSLPSGKIPSRIKLLDQCDHGFMALKICGKLVKG